MFKKSSFFYSKQQIKSKHFLDMQYDTDYYNNKINNYQDDLI